MRGTWQTTGGSDGSFLRLVAFVAGAVVLASSGTAAALAGLLTSLVEVMGAIVVSLIALTALMVVLLYRRGWRPSLDPVVAYTPLPEPERARGLPAPQFHLHLHGTPTREQLDEVAAIREAGYPKWRAEARERRK